MASAKLSVTISLRDLMSVKLLVMQLELLAAEMRVAANPAAESLTKILDRWAVRAETEGEDG